MTPEEARARFRESPVAYLATADAGAVPHIVPITFAVEGHVISTVVDGKPKRGSSLRRIANIDANPSVAVLVERYDADWGRLWWARADGHAVVARHGAPLAHAIELLRARYPQYADVALDGPAILIRVARWSGWAASGS